MEAVAVRDDGKDAQGIYLEYSASNLRPFRYCTACNVVPSTFRGSTSDAVCVRPVATSSVSDCCSESQIYQKSWWAGLRFEAFYTDGKMRMKSGIPVMS